MAASRALEAAYGKQCKIWDVAAGALLIREAGGCIIDPFGGDLLPFDLTADPNRDIPFLAGGSDDARAVAPDDSRNTELMMGSSRLGSRNVPRGVNLSAAKDLPAQWDASLRSA